jgi:GDP/UDP-N,N'-diacetylbacillosamine 2-epimerase (hydrolysing)
MRIPIAHINGGEITQGAVDDAMRHAITKMSALHFVTTEEYRNRVIQLGEQPTRVFLVGGLGAQSVNELELLTKAELEKQLDLKFMKKNLIVTFHPATLEKTRPSLQFAEILEAISQLEDTLTIFTYPNADHDGLELISLIKQHVATHENAVSFPSLGQLRYLSVLAQVDGVIGNSSSGLVEAPSFGIGTVNIGSRQKGRVLPESVINCAPICQEVYDSIRKMYSVEFQKILSESKNPHDRGASSKKIVAILEGIDTSTLSVKEFFDLNLIDEREV